CGIACHEVVPLDLQPVKLHGQVTPGHVARERPAREGEGRVQPGQLAEQDATRHGRTAVDDRDAADAEARVGERLAYAVGGAVGQWPEEVALAAADGQVEQPDVDEVHGHASDLGGQ